MRSSYGDRPGDQAAQWGGWAKRSMAKWREWDATWGKEMKIQLFFTAGDVIARATTTDAFIRNNKTMWDKIGAKYEVLTKDEVRYRYPQFQLEDMEAFLSTLRNVIDDPAVEVVPDWGEDARPVTPPSRLDTEMFLALVRAQQRMFPKAITLPMMLTGATDSAQLRAKGVQAYGVGSLATEEDGNRIHGNDERLSISGLRTFLEFLHSVVVDVAGAK